MSRAQALVGAVTSMNEDQPRAGDIEDINGTLFLTGPRGWELDAERLTGGKVKLTISQNDRAGGDIILTAKQVLALIKQIK